MNSPSSLTHALPFAFPIFFGLLWLCVTTVLSFLSGWFGLMQNFPDKPGPALFEIKHASGSMGLGVSMNGILALGVCSSGLRIGIWRIFGPFSRDFLVPWSELRVERRTRLLWKTANLKFGSAPLGHLEIAAYQADRLALAAGALWPERGPIKSESPANVAREIGLQWLAVTGLAASFYILAPLLLSGGKAHVPIIVAILFPAIFFGGVCLIRYFDRIRR